MASAVMERLASLIAPPLCAACGSARSGDQVLCQRCSTGLAAAPRVREPGPPDVDLAVSASPFDGVARLIVKLWLPELPLWFASPAKVACAV